MPRIVKAKIMSVDPVAARKRAEEEKRRTAAKQREADQRRQAEAKRKRELERKKAEQKKLEQQRLAEQKKAEQKKAEQKKADQRKAEAERKRVEADRLAKQKQQELAQQLERERELEIARALDAETEFMQSQSAAQEAQSYVGVIQERVIQSWQRPLSARNGMQALLMIHLLPTGEVHNVYVVESSGDAAFDRSAVKAVQRAEKFEELQKLSPRVFDAHFRQFKMLFKPEDLVR